MLKPSVPKLRSGLSVCVRDIAEKQVLAKLKPMTWACQLLITVTAGCVAGVSTANYCYSRLCRANDPADYGQHDRHRILFAK